MLTSKIDLCCQALLKIGANSISSFEDGTAESEIAANLYGSIRDAIVSCHPWNFAARQATLNKLAIPPVADYEDAFSLPHDCVRVLSAGTSGRGRGLSYRVTLGQLHTNANEVVLTYVALPDESHFPPFFSLALIARLAAEFCIPLTESTSRWDSLRKFAEEELRTAKLIDSQQDSPPRFEDFTLVSERY